LSLFWIPSCKPKTGPAGVRSTADTPVFPRPRDEPRVPFYQRGRVKQIVVVIQAKSEAFAKEHAR
jgi:hypothetical protein